MLVVAATDEAQHIDAIVNSRTFQKATALRSLLRYLWDHRAEDISEYAIAVDALGRPADFEPKADATVRVQIGRLRQKLKEYYDEEGRDATRQIAIPLGKYQVEIVNKAAPEVMLADTASIARLRRGLMLLGALAVLLAGACIFFFVEGRQLKAQSTAAAAGSAATAAGLEQAPLPWFWQRFLADERATKLVMSHPVFFRWSGSTLKVRDTQVNDYRDFDKSKEMAPLIQQHGRPLLMQNYTVASDTFAAIELVRYLDARRRPLTVISSAEWSIGSGEADNVILLGTAGVTLRFRHLLERTNFGPTAEGDGFINRQPKAGEPPEYRVAVESLTRRTAPGFIGLLPAAGPRGGRLLLLIGVETTALAHVLTVPSTLAVLERAWRDAGSPPWFEALVEAEVNSGTVLDTKLLAFRPFAAAQ
jgi:hypothetical protein